MTTEEPEDYGDDVELAQRRAGHRSEEEKRRAEEYGLWLGEMVQAADEKRPALKQGVVAETDFWPDVWLNAGIDLIRSGNPTKNFGRRYPQFFDGPEDLFPRYVLEYPVFQLGTEFFLKGMWLLQFPELRPFQSQIYLKPNVRESIGGGLKDMSHDVYRMLQSVSRIPEYAADAEIVRFLRVVAGVATYYYYPFHGRSVHWAHSRYPRKFYSDEQRKAVPDSGVRRPYQWMVLRTFLAAENRLNDIWFPNGERTF